MIGMLLLTSPAGAQLVWRVSVKQILDPNGNLPVDGVVTNRASAELQIEAANQLLGYGYNDSQYRLLLTEYMTVPNANNFWKLVPSVNAVIDIQSYAQTHSNYGWRNDAINIYITHATSGPNGGYNVGSTIVVVKGLGGRGWLHEIGHSFGLAHTFIGSSCCNRDIDPACSHTFAPNGVLPDLIPDLECDTSYAANDVAMNWFGKPLLGLNPGELAVWDMTYNNLMSYHNGEKLSDYQKDIMAIMSNRTFPLVTSGRTWFVSNSGFVFGFNPYTSSSLPTIQAGIDAATPGDVVMIHSDQYVQSSPLEKAVTLRASRGHVIIRAP